MRDTGSRPSAATCLHSDSSLPTGGSSSSRTFHTSKSSHLLAHPRSHASSDVLDTAGHNQQPPETSKLVNPQSLRRSSTSPHARDSDRAETSKATMPRPGHHTRTKPATATSVPTIRHHLALGLTVILPRTMSPAKVYLLPLCLKGSFR